MYPNSEYLLDHGGYTFKTHYAKVDESGDIKYNTTHYTEPVPLNPTQTREKVFKLHG